MTLSRHPALDIAQLYQVETPAFDLRAARLVTGTDLVRFSGVMCTFSVAEVPMVLERWLRDTAPATVALDLGSVDFMDGRGVAVILEFGDMASRAGADWSITHMSRLAERVLRLCGCLPVTHR